MNTDTLLASLKSEAAASMAAWPQYAGHFDGYRLGRATRNVKTKLGLVVAKGDVVLFRDERNELTGAPSRTFWSRSAAIDVQVPAATVSELR